MIWLDTETRSSVNIRKSNVYRYVEDPDFAMLMLTYAKDDGPVQRVTDPAEIRSLVTSWDGETLCAHNSAFDRVALSAIVGVQYLDPDQWEDTAVWAAEAGYPRALGKLAKALKVEEKDTAGTALINWFCKPQKDGTFREPEGEKWDEFCRYGMTDVEVMRACAKKLPRPIQFERELWLASERINDRGMPVDIELAEHAVVAGTKNIVDATARVSELLKIENPGSLQQLTKGLAETGLEVPNLRAKTVENLLAGELTPVQREALELRQELALSASKKFQAALEGVCLDGRIRGSFKFYGASTGRYTGSGTQPQNLPRAALTVSRAEAVDHAMEHDVSVKDAQTRLDIAKTEKAIDHLKQTDQTDPFTLKALVRSMFLGPITVCDFSSIEARVLAWLAGEQWALDAFARGDDIYSETAAKMGPQFTRQEGKAACLAEGTLVLTDRGEVPIQDVQKSDLVWDGVEWVPHDGVIYQGNRVVYRYDGLTATADHKVWTEESDGPVRFDHASSSGAHLIRSGSGRRSVWVGENPKSRTEVRQRLVEPVCSHQVHRLRSYGVDESSESTSREIKRVSGLFTSKKDTKVAGSETYSSKTTMHQSERFPLVKVWREGDRVSIPIYSGSGVVGSRQPRPASRQGTGSSGQRRSLRTGELEMGHEAREREQPRDNKAGSVSTRGVALLGRNNTSNGFLGPIERTDIGSGKTSGYGKKKKLEGDCREARVFDIVNAGPRHRFTANGKLVSNCLGLGYNGSINALRNIGMEGKKEELQPIVSSWRAANPRIVKFWPKLFDTWVRGGRVGKIAVTKTPNSRVIHLPSGGSIVYRGVRFETYVVEVEDEEGKVTKKSARGWRYNRPEGGRVRTWSGIIVENVCQRVARDLLAHALINLDRAGYPTIGHVHDEVLVEGYHDDIAQIMCDTPEWAKGLPVDADGFKAARYRKG